MGYIPLIVQLVLLAWVGTSYATGELPDKPKAQQKKRAEGQEIRLVDTYCSYNGERIKGKIYSFTASDEMQAALDQVKAYSPPSESTLLASTITTIAVALIADEQSLILYNPEKLNKVEKKSSTGFLSKAILAHEVGHLQLGHLSSSKKDKEKRHQEELMADRYSGMVLRQLGAKLDEALAAVELAANKVESETHPDKELRKAAIASGWDRPQDIKNSLNHQVAFSKSRYVPLKVENDPEGAYFVGPDNDIFKVSSEGDVLLVGQKDEVWNDALPKPVTSYKIGRYYAKAKTEEPFNYVYDPRTSGDRTASTKVEGKRREYERGRAAAAK